KVGTALIACNVVLGDDSAAPVHKDPAPDTQCLNLVLEDPWVNEDPASDTEFGFFINKTGRHHPDAVFMVPDLHRVPGIGADTATGDDYWFIRKCDMGNNLALPLIPKKATYDNCTAHWNIM